MALRGWRGVAHPFMFRHGTSFGTRLIEQGFVGELRGEAHLAFEPSGVVCRLDIPLAAVVPLRTLQMRQNKNQPQQELPISVPENFSVVLAPVLISDNISPTSVLGVRRAKARCYKIVA